MKQVIKQILLLVFIFNSFYVAAQDTLNLTLENAISYALTNNKTLTNAKYLTDKSRAKILETRATGLPQINASVDYNNFLGAEIELQLSEQAPPAVIAFNPTSSMKLNVSQLIFSGNYFVGLELSKLALKTTELNYLKSELDVKEQVSRSYSLILIAEKTLQIIIANKNYIQTIYEKTNNLAKAGIIEKYEADKLSVMVSSVENAQRNAERQLEMAYNMLRFHLGLDSDSKIKLITLMQDIYQQDKFEAALITPFKIENNLDFQLLLSQENIILKQVTFEKSSYLPTVAGYYSLTEKLLKPKFDMSPKNVIGLSMSVPILSGGLRKARVSQANINLDINNNNKELLTQQLSLQEKQLRFNLNNLLDQFESQKRNVQVAKEIVDNISLKFQFGTASTLELTNANSNYLSAEANFVNLQFQLIDADIALRKLNGNL